MTTKPAPRSFEGRMLAAIVAAFFAVYVIWGSTYLVIRIAIEGGLPPLTMAGMRHLSAGALLLVFAYLQSGYVPRRADWKHCWLPGVLFMAVGNGSVTWAERFVPSGLAALFVASLPMWMTLLNFLAFERRRPHPRVLAGLVLGFVSVGALALHGRGFDGAKLSLFGPVLLIVASLGWAIGSLLSRASRLVAPAAAIAAMQMCSGGAALVALGTVRGEWSEFGPAALSPGPLSAFAYLVLLGSIVGFTAFSWLIRVVEPSKVATYAFVNPVVAVALGVGVGGESLSGIEIWAAAFVVVAVALIVLAPGSTPRRPPDAVLDRPPNTSVDVCKSSTSIAAGIRTAQT